MLWQNSNLIILMLLLLVVKIIATRLDRSQGICRTYLLTLSSLLFLESSFLGISDNKKQLIELICKKLATMVQVSFNALLITGPSSRGESGVATIWEDLFITHEKADISVV